MSALIPLLAMSPSAMATSSAEYPREPATGATYLKDSPIMETFVFAFVAALANMSAKRALSLALIPNAVNASVTMSEVVPSSSPDAAARFMIPLIPLSMSSVFHPAIPMYSNACPASVAEYLLVAPISRAFSLSWSNSSPVAPEIALTLDICVSKSAVTLTAPPSAVAIGRLTLVVISFPTAAMLSPTSLILSPTSFTFAPTACICCEPTDPNSFNSFSALASATVSRSICVWRSLAALLFASNPSVFFICSSACFSLSSFVFASVTASLSSLCLSFSKLTFDGSSLSALFISRRLLCVFLTALSTS